VGSDTVDRRQGESKLEARVTVCAVSFMFGGGH
jgi:hypothetical protein